MSSPASSSMSKRLLTMSFMQRAAASGVSSPATPRSDDHSPKRRRTGPNSPASDVAATFDLKALEAAQEEEEKRRKAVEKLAAQTGEEHWVLDIPQNPNVAKRRPTQLDVEYVGWAQIDEERDVVGRRSYGKSKVADKVGLRCLPGDQPLSCLLVGLPESQDQADSLSSGSDDDEDDSLSDEDDQTKAGHDRTPNGKNATGRHERPRSESRRTLESIKAAQLAKERRKKIINLNRLTGISASSSSVKCFKCGKDGHRQSECRQAQKRQ